VGLCGSLDCNRKRWHWGGSLGGSLDCNSKMHLCWIG